MALQKGSTMINDTLTNTCTKKITLSASDMENAIASLMSKAKERRKTSANNKLESGDDGSSSSSIKISNGKCSSNSSNDNTKKNALSDLIPGYIAPLSLDSSSLDTYKRRKSNNTIINHENQLKAAAAESKINQIETKPSDFQSKNFKMAKKDPLIQAKQESNAGSGWFGFEAAPNSSSLQADIAIIRNRNYIDPKKFYKRNDMGKKGERRLVQLGTVIEGSMESVYSNRLTKKQRKNNLLEEVMGETFHSKDDYVKRKYTNMQRERTNLAAKRKKRGKKL